jgi:hypothetical protein
VTEALTPRALEHLPGADLVLRGLEDLAAGRATPEAALVEIARTRLRALGLSVSGAAAPARAPELELYARLGARHPDRDPYGLYCAWLDQLASFLAALELHRLPGPAAVVTDRS